MKKSVLGIIIALIAIIGIAAVVAMNSKQDRASMTDSSQEMTNKTSGDTNSEQSSSENQNTNKVSIIDHTFSPKKIVIKKGTTVTWTNTDSTRHDIMPDEDYGDAFTPSELLARNETYSFTFNTAGIYEYHCSPHPYMKATVEVTE